MNDYPWWRHALVAAVLAFGLVYALPNLFGHDPALQISGRRAAVVDAELAGRIDQALAAAGAAAHRSELHAGRLLLRFTDVDSRSRARPIVEQTAGDKFIVALNLAPATPVWLRQLGAKPMYMGLDLRGGVHFLMQVDMQAVAVQTEERFVSELRTAFREAKVRYRSIARAPEGGIEITYLNEDMKLRGNGVLGGEFVDLERQDAKETPTTAVVSVKQQAIDEIRKPVIQQQGEDRIVVQLPGVEDTAEAKKILGATATLEFRMVDFEGDAQAAANGGRVPVNAKLFYEKNGAPILLDKRVMLTGEYIIDAASGIDQQSGGPAVFITLDGKGARLFSRATRDQIGKPMAVDYIEQRQGRPVEEVINVATIRDELSKRFQISGLDSTNEAATLALLLRAGALAAPIEIVEERTVGPSLGQENIDTGIMSTFMGLALVVIFTSFYYKIFGLIASIAVIFNVILVVALMSILQATLSLPGIAGIVLTVGMSVDANVLINERIREELRNGNSPHTAIKAGYERAFATITDANLTILWAAIALFMLGSGPVKGFAVTLALGIVTSMFTATTATRAIVNLVYGRRRIKKLWV
jgi:preprotein translocase subunit SecD